MNESTEPRESGNVEVPAEAVIHLFNLAFQTELPRDAGTAEAVARACLDAWDLATEHDWWDQMPLDEDDATAKMLTITVRALLGEGRS